MNIDTILLDHGEGGRSTHELIDSLFRSHFSNPYLDHLCDAAVLPGRDSTLAFTTDSYVIQPIFFPGGDIGKLAVCGTVNDLSMVGAIPLYLTAGYILEEGLALADLVRIVVSMAEAAAAAGTMIVAGDTKVVGRGSADSIFINTAGIGFIPDGLKLSPGKVREGDRIIVSGSMGDHGMAILCQREGLQFHTALVSDCAPLNGLVRSILTHHNGVRVMRDPTRGGLATTLAELARNSSLGFEIEEMRVPVEESVRAGCELLGLNPLYLPNEGKLVLISDPDDADAIVETMRGHVFGREAVIIGRVVKDHPNRVVLKTVIGARRVLDMLTGAQLPRIC